MRCVDVRVYIHILKYRVCFSYKKRVEEFVKGNHSNVLPVIKAHLVCEEQLRYDDSDLNRRLFVSLVKTEL